MSWLYMGVEMQLGGFDGGVAIEEPCDQEVVPGAHKFFMFQQSVFISH